MKRRSFLGLLATGAALPRSTWAGLDLPEPTPKDLPRWRGFNLLEKFMAGNPRPFREEDFDWIADLGFNFVRLPMDYRCWTDPALDVRSGAASFWDVPPDRAAR